MARLKPFDIGNVGGIPFMRTDLDSAVRWTIEVAAAEHVATAVRLANAYCVAVASEDAAYFRLLSTCGINFPDGAPVAWVLNRLRDEPRASRVRGPSFFEETIAAGLDSSVKHFFIGATPETLDKLRSNLTDRYPGIEIAGMYSPPFAPVDQAFIADCVAATETTAIDIIWIGLGTPKQDFVSQEVAMKTGRTTIGVGAAFDYAAGTSPQAPQWIQQSGFEWLFRLSVEPKRLWKRYLVGNLQFIRVVLRGMPRVQKSGGGHAARSGN